MVSSPTGNGGGHSVSTSADIEPVVIPDEQAASPDRQQLSKISRLAIIRRRFELQGFSSSIIDLLLASNRPNTRSAYESSWSQWDDWCV